VGLTISYEAVWNVFTSEWEEQETDIQGDIINPSGSSLP
jgi:hypothetical protein